MKIPIIICTVWCLLGTMSFIRTKTKNGRRYQYLVESSWDKEKKRSTQKVIQYLGVETEKDGKKTVKTPSHRMDTIERAIPIGKLAIYYSAAKSINLTGILFEHCYSESFEILSLTLNQLCNRQSLIKAARWINDSPLAEWEEETKELTRLDLDRALGKICYVKDGVKSNIGFGIQRSVSEMCNSLDRKKRDKLFYDVTKLTYFGNKCEYSGKGYTSTLRGKWTIGVGFLVYKDTGFPHSCFAIPGSKHDTVTMEDMITSIDTTKYKGIPIIVDRGLVSTRNISMARRRGFHIIACCPATNNEVVDSLGYLEDDDICSWENAVKRPSEDMVYVKGWKGELYGQNGFKVVVLNPTRKALEKSNRDMMVKELTQTSDKKRIKELRSVLSSIVVKQKGRRGFKVDEDLMMEEERLDGRHLLFCTDQRFSGKSVFETYYQRDEIEKAFRCMKGNISLGPIRYQRPERIDAYLTIVFLAYALRSIVKHRLKKSSLDMSVEEAEEELKSLTLVEYSYNGKIRRKISRTTKNQLKLMKALRINKYIPSAYNG